MRGGAWRRGEGVPLIQWCALVAVGGIIVFIVMLWIG